MEQVKRLMIILLIFLPLQLVSGQDKIVTKPSHRWLAGIQTGGSFSIAFSDESWRSLIFNNMSKLQIENFNNQLKRGWHLNGDIHYMISDKFGLGAQYSFFTSSAKTDFIVSSHGYIPTFVCVELKGNQYINYTGLSVIFREWTDKNQKLLLTKMFSVGHVDYRDEYRINATFNLDNALVKGNTWGANFRISMDYFLISWLSIGANVGFMYARIAKLHISDKKTTQTVELDKKYYQSLARFDCSLGIRFTFL